MFYCDECAKKNKIPILADENMKSYGKCEICKKVRPCNDIKHDMLELGAVTIYNFKSNEFLKLDKKSFKAPKGKFRIVGFDMKKLFGDDEIVFVPVNYVKDFSKKTEAVKQVISLRNNLKHDNKNIEQCYYLFNDEGYFEKIN